MGVQGRLSRTFTGALLALSLALPVAAQSGHTGTLDSIKIYNFGRVNANYYRGGQPGVQDFVDLASLGVKTVIDLQADGDPGEGNVVESSGMKFFRIGMTTSVAPTSGQIAQFLQIVNDPANQPVYVHCAGGRHRTGVMTAVYRITEDQWTPDQAFKEMKTYKFGADFLHPEFKSFVYAFHPQPSAPTTTTLAENATATK